MVIRFQKEGSQVEQTGVLLWLKNLIQIHWTSIVKNAEGEDLKNLGAI